MTERKSKPVAPQPPQATEAAATVSQLQASIDTSRMGQPLSSSKSSPLDPPVPQHFGRYKIEQELGKGAMGVVYLAEDTQLGRKVALKIPKKSILEETDALERFYREAKTTSQIRHPNICPVYDVGAIDGTHYLTMAYIPGKPVSSFLGKGKLPAAKQVALLIRKIALALEEAHKQGVVHRDLKPSNIMLDDRGEPIVMDFGLACQMNTAENARLTQSGAILGTPAYMAPEQVRGELAQIGPVSDIYALGVMFYQFLTGELPFSGPVMMVFAQIISNQPKRPSEVRPEVDPTLEAICLKMMAKDIPQRFASMKDVAGALTEYLKKGSVTGLEVTSTVTTAATIHEPEPSFENLSEFPEFVVEPPKSRKNKKKSAKSPAIRRPGWFWAAVGVAGLSLIAVLSAVFYVQTGTGMVMVTVDDPTIKVKFHQQEITFETEDGEPIKVRAGKQSLLVERAGFNTETLSFTLQNGEEKRLTVTLVEDKPTLAEIPSDPQVPQSEAEAEQAAQRLKETPPVTQAGDGWTDLLSQAERTAGSRWLTNEKNSLVGFAGGPKHIRSRLLLPVEPQGSYEVELRFQLGAIPMEEVLLLNLPVGNREVTFACLPRKPKLTGLGKIQGRTRMNQLATDTTIHQQVELKPDTVYQLTASVSVNGDRGDVLVSLDGAPWVSWTGPLADLSRGKGWNEPKENALGMDVGVTIGKKEIATIIVSAIRYRELDSGSKTPQVTASQNDSPLTVVSPNPGPAAPTPRRLWVQPRGYFIQGMGNEWFEKYDDGKKPPNLFHEKLRTAEYVELRHAHVPVSFRLYADKALIKDDRKKMKDFETGHPSGKWQPELKLADPTHARWVHSRGYFLQGLNGDWFEKWNDGKPGPLLFGLQLTTNDYLQLRNRLAPVTIQLFPDKALIKDELKKETKFTRVYQGRWEAQEQTQSETPAAAPVPNTNGFTYPVNGDASTRWNFARLTGHNRGPNRNGAWQTGSATKHPELPQQLKVYPGGDDLICTSLADDIYTDEKYGDVRVELEFMIPSGSNSGIFLMGEYEININDTEKSGHIIHGPDPLEQANLPSGEWQSFDITFRAPRFDASGKKIADAKLEKVIYNGKRIHTDVALGGVTADPSLLTGKESATGPLLLQGSIGPVAYRNIRITPLNDLASETAAAVPADAKSHNGHRYKFFPEQLSWKAAQAKCTALGGHLIVINNLDENAFAGKLVAEAGWVDCWIGATDEDKEGAWRTIHGDPLPFTNWSDGQPNNKKTGEHYALISNMNTKKGLLNWRWSDQPNVSTQHKPGYLCEWDSAPAVSAPANDGWIDLFNGKDLSNWITVEGKFPRWKVENGYVEVVPGAKSIMTGEKYPLDVELHAEFWLPKDLSPSGSKGHSGIYLLGRHEIQIYDSFSHKLPNPKGVCGALWGEIAPSGNAWTAPETWQTFDITFHGPRVNKQKKVTTPGRLTVLHNDKKVIGDGRFNTLASPGSQNDDAGQPGPIVLQDGGLKVRFRNLRIRPLKK